MEINLQNSLISASSRSINEGIPRGAPVSIRDGSPNEQFLKSFPKLPGHPAVNSEVDGVAEDDEEVGEKDEDVGDVVVEEVGPEDGGEDVEEGDDG